MRNADQTKANIFAAAVEEFSDKGFDGARIDKIAERSGVNKRMIYVYWGDKEDLYREILRRKVVAMHEVFTTDWRGAAESLVRYFEGTVGDTELLRFIQWEALGDLTSNVTAEEERRETFKLNVEALVRDQQAGNLTSGIPAEYLMLVFMALASYPMAFPQNTRLVTGLNWQDAEFQQNWSAALTFLGKMLATGSIPPVTDPPSAPVKRSRAKKAPKTQ